jgi:hypothetical protein
VLCLIKPVDINWIFVYFSAAGTRRGLLKELLNNNSTREGIN